MSDESTRGSEWSDRVPKDLWLRLIDSLSYQTCSADDLWDDIRTWLVENEVPITASVLSLGSVIAHPIHESAKFGNTGKKGKPMDLTRLVYTSTHDDANSTTLDSILQVSRANNVRDGITGALIISRDSFLQLLEGERSAVGKCFMRIMQDRRHHSIQVISSGDFENRLFYEWSMHRIETSEIKEEILSRYKIDGEFRPNKMRQFAIEDMCRTLAQGQWQSLVA